MATTITPDTVIHFDINPGTLLQFLEARAESGPRLTCVEGDVTLVASGMTHGKSVARINDVVLAVCQELRIKLANVGRTTWTLPGGFGDTAYEADASYFIQSYGTEEEFQPPDLTIEVVVSHSEKKALRAGAFLKIPEMWVFDMPRHRLTFYQLAARGKQKGTYRAQPRSRAFPVMASAEVLERLDDPETDSIAFHENCRGWARQVLVPRLR